MVIKHFESFKKILKTGEKFNKNLEEIYVKWHNILFPHIFFAKILGEQTHSKFFLSNFGGAIAPLLPPSAPHVKNIQKNMLLLPAISRNIQKTYF